MKKEKGKEKEEEMILSDAEVWSFHSRIEKVIPNTRPTIWGEWRLYFLNFHKTPSETLDLGRVPWDLVNPTWDDESKV